MQPNSIATTGGFIIEGMRDLDWQAILKAWDNGCIELVTEVCSYAVLLDGLSEAGFEANNNAHPGIFHYDVTNDFGQWFAAEVIRRDNGTCPDRIECLNYILTAAERFFTVEGKLDNNVKLALIHKFSELTK